MKVFSYRRLIFTVVFILFILAIIFLHLAGFVKIDLILREIRLSGGSGMLIFLAILILAILLWFPTPPLVIAAGFIFGHYRGFAISFIGAIIGAMLTFFIGRYF